MLLEVEEIFGSRDELGDVQVGTAFTSCMCGAGEQARSAGRCGGSQPRAAHGDVGTEGGLIRLLLLQIYLLHHLCRRGFLKPFKLAAGPDG